MAEEFIVKNPNYALVISTDKRAKDNSKSIAEEKTRMDKVEGYLLDIFFTDGSQGLEYTLSDEHYLCVGIGECDETDIEIANVVRGVPVEGTKTNAFENCTTITSVIIPDGITGLRNGTFANCINLAKVSIGEGLKLLNTIFSGCTSLKELTLPKSLNTILTNVFKDCSSLSDVYYAGTILDWRAITIVSGNEPLTNATIHYSKNKGLIYGIATSGKSAYLQSVGTCEDTKVVIENVYEGLPVTTISGSAFESCTNITDILIPDSVTFIQVKAFYGCSSLKDITIPDSVTSVQGNVFANCSSLETAVIGNGLTKLSYMMFGNCTNLKSVTIPKSVTSIDMGAFHSCNSLTDVYYEGTETEWSLITIESGNNALASATIHFESEV